MVMSQTVLPAGFPLLEELERRKQLQGFVDRSHSFSIRPIHLNETSPDTSSVPLTNKTEIHYLPLLNSTRYTTGRPYGWGSFMMTPSVGFQNYVSGGVEGGNKWFRFRFQPEVLLSENRSFNGFPDYFPSSVNQARFRYWNTGDFPELFADSWNITPWWGQSKIALGYGAFELGLGTENIWWGPGQWNALIFSNNAQGFPHVSFNTRKPAKTFLGNFEGQLIVGRLENSMRPATQHPSLNSSLGRGFTGDWRYLNAVNITFNPFFAKSLFVGINRSQQQYSSDMGNSFVDFLPVLEPFQKIVYGFERDEEGRDQQTSVFARFVSVPAKTELYVEYGRRDHALNWREFILNPEHARAYLLGFTKLVSLESSPFDLQIRAEMVHQQESVNRFVRYPGLGGNITWHTHWRARGFVQNGQPLGVGVGVGSNAQTVEIALVDGIQKRGILLERLENHQDFFYRAFGQDSRMRPWVDLSIGFIFANRWNERLVTNSKLQFISTNNYQWNQNQLSTVAEFSQADIKVNALFQIDFVYQINTKKNIIK
ncbi:hypothetical protein GCM10008106_10350 [Mongoliitalea lutea]|uniref:Capsule assembly protein Wzi n=2 Tax=Mongoliitalea lutea TaxID=849756 RepID=A0A8J3G4P9_9BACT|nr:hypothetical protein GCM10008106_10350 [Mongoliitalea lutea]